MRFLLGILLVTSGCGYSLQNTYNPLEVGYGVRRIYVAPINNETYQAGVENTVFSSLIKTLGHHKRVRIVNSPDDADAILEGSVTQAGYSAHTATTASQLNPRDTGRDDVTISTIYTASLSCGFVLIKKGGQFAGKTIWSSSFIRQKRFPSATQLSIIGTTSALINQSEFKRALGDLSNAMMEDVHESMLAMF